MGQASIGYKAIFFTSDVIKGFVDVVGSENLLFPNRTTSMSSGSGSGKVKEGKKVAFTETEPIFASKDASATEPGASSILHFDLASRYCSPFDCSKSRGGEKRTKFHKEEEVKEVKGKSKNLPPTATSISNAIYNQNVLFYSRLQKEEPRILAPLLAQ